MNSQVGRFNHLTPNVQSPCTTRTVLYQLHPLHLLYIMLHLLLSESAPASGRDALLPASTSWTCVTSRARRMKLPQNLCHYCSRSVDAGRLDCDANPRLVLFLFASPSSTANGLSCSLTNPGRASVSSSSSSMKSVGAELSRLPLLRSSSSSGTRSSAFLSPLILEVKACAFHRMHFSDRRVCAQAKDMHSVPRGSN
jgi:hypothetical protein